MHPITHPSNYTSVHSPTHPFPHLIHSPTIQSLTGSINPPHPFTSPSIHPPIHSSTNPFINQSIHASTHPFVHPPIYSTIHPHPSILSIHSYIHSSSPLSIYPPVRPPI